MTERWLDSGDPEWPLRVASAVAADTYHDAPYHRMAEARGEGAARFFVLEHKQQWLAVPLLIRPIDGQPRLSDATSVYGYVGPVTSVEGLDESLIAAFQEQLAVRLRAERVVSLVARLHPLIRQVPLLEGLGEVKTLGQTVAIDLTAAPETQIARYRTNHRRDIQRLARDGYCTRIDNSAAAQVSFIEIYTENMRRLGADARYFFDATYFEMLRQALGSSLDFFICRRGQEIAGGACFIRYKGLVQYHLGAVTGDHLQAAPLKQLLDTARSYYAAAGARVLHLGGGRGGRNDSLFAFKAGFGGVLHDFRLWCWILDRETYESLSEGQTLSPYFPAYRTPAVP